MILRKPYAFLIKYFRQINLILLLLIAFIFYKNLEIYKFAQAYLETGVYNNLIDSINNYANIYVYLSFFLIIIITSILTYLLRYKHKPYISYIMIIIATIITLAFFIYTDNYFTYQVVDGYNLVAARVIKDLLLISSFFYYPILLVLLIRSIGLDLKSFGFQEDKEFITDEKDREEVEVEVAFNKQRYIRKLKNRIRHTKYFILEHKVPLLIVFLIVSCIFSYNTYHYFYVENRIYNMNQTFKSNNYKLNVKHAYLTDKDYTGNIVSEEGRYFILIDLNITNILNMNRDFDIEKMLLFVDNDYYVPTIKYNKHFIDMGNLYIKKSIKPKENLSYLLVYEVNKPKENSNLILKYQDTNIKNNKLIRVSIKIQDISSFKDKGTSSINNEYTIPLNENDKVTFSLKDYQITDSISYTYQSCDPYSCPIYQDKIIANNNQKILYLKGNYGDYTTDEFLTFLKKYGKITYKINDQIYTTNIKYALSKKYIGNYIYILIPNSINDANYIELTFTVRTYQYHYILKGE